MTRKYILNHLSIVFILLAMTAATAFAQGNGFNFQGRLNDGTNPANGQYDLQFRLYNAATGGAQINSTLARPATVLINGVFSTTLDFGATAFNNPSSVFIEIAVKPAGSPNAYTILGPRQQLTVVPFSVRANNATNADFATNATNAQNAINATNATTAATATNALSLGGVPAANYAKLEVINPGQFVMDGNVRQSLNSNGLVKAMIAVGQTGAILRCYNGTTGVSTGNCGFSVEWSSSFPGNYTINFGFPVINRFVAITAQQTFANSGGVNIGTGYNFPPSNPNQLYIRTYISDVDFNSSSASNPFIAIIY